MFFLIPIIFVVLFDVCHGYEISVEPGEVQCFFNRFNKTDYVSIIYEVHDGGYLDISFSLRDPRNKTLHSAINTHEKMLINADETGPYEVCFDNGPAVSQQIKDVMFFFEIDHSKRMESLNPLFGNSTDEERLENMINELASNLKACSRRNMLLDMRQKYHVQLSKAIDGKIVAFAFFQSVLAGFGSWLQVYMTQRLFEVRLCV
ncbi:unnamed protein product [Bursaphelenchus xylophilus]|nr:unnamed protein product [Bursaphelenchus xylophilus]CAG9100369.1 unnamed protein product [Bursaphelenchus xylophilus]